MFGIGTSITNLGMAGGMADAADGSMLAWTLLPITEINGLAIDFTDMSYAIRVTTTAELMLGAGTGLAIDFTNMTAEVKV